MTEHNRIRKIVAKIAAAVLTIVMVVQAAVPVTEVQAATHTPDRMLEIPVSFQTDRTYAALINNEDFAAYTCTGYSIGFNCDGSDFAPGLSRLNYTICIPENYLEEDTSSIVCDMHISVYGTKFLWGCETAVVAISADGVKILSTFNGIKDFYPLEDVAEQSDSMLDVQMKKKGDFYLVSIDTKVDLGDESGTQYAKSGAADLDDVTVYFAPSIYGFSMDVPDGDLYLDDLTFTSVSGETLHTEDFENSEDVLDVWTYIYDGSGNKTTIKTLNVETIYDNELLTTLKSKISVKKGKKKSLSAYVNAVSTDDVTYTSSNKKVATVNSKGVVKGKKKGTATITVTANGVKKKIKVTVK